MMDDKTKTQVMRFIGVGLVATVVDGGTYFAGLHLAGLSHSPSKAISFILGTIVSYVLNKLWTFESSERNHRELVAFCMLYGATFFLNVGVNEGSLAVLSPLRPEAVPVPMVELTCFVIATACSTVANFIGNKLWVFRDDG